MYLISILSGNVYLQALQAAIESKIVVLGHNKTVLGHSRSKSFHKTVGDSFWIARLVMNHNFSASELQMGCFVHVNPSHVNTID